MPCEHYFSGILIILQLYFSGNNHIELKSNKKEVSTVERTGDRNKKKKRWISFFKKKTLPPYVTLYQSWHRRRRHPPGANNLPQNNTLKTKKTLKSQIYVQIEYWKRKTIFSAFFCGVTWIIVWWKIMTIIIVMITDYSRVWNSDAGWYWKLVVVCSHHEIKLIGVCLSSKMMAEIQYKHIFI